MDMSYSDMRAKAREILAGNWKAAIIVTLLAGLLGGLLTGSGMPELDLDEETLQYLPDFVLAFLGWYAAIAGTLSIAQFILGGVIRQGYVVYLLKLHDGQEADVKDLFSQFYSFSDGFVLALLQSLFIALWTVLFIIPGIIAAYSYSMAPFLMQEHPELSPMEALKSSKAMMKGHKGELFTLELTFIGWDLLNLLTWGIGSLWLNPYKNAAHAVFYRDLHPKSSIIDAEAEIL
jgi:uncharacterized membrane protein